MNEPTGRLFNRREIESIVGIASTLGLRMLGMAMILPVFTLFARELGGTNPFLAGIALGAYGLTQTVILVPLGRISDRFGRKPVVMFCLTIFLIANIAAATAQHIMVLIIARLFQGAGAIASAAYAWIADAIRVDRRNRAIAYIGMGVGIGLAAGLTVGPIIGGIFGLRAVFWLCAFTTLLSIVYITAFMKDPPRREYHREIEFDTGQFKAVLGNRDLWALYLCGFLSYSTLCAVFYILPLLLSRYLEPVDFWMIFLPLSILGMTTMIICSRIADRGQTRFVLMLGFGFTACSGLSLLLSDSPLVVFFAILVYYMGFSILEPILATSVTKYARSDLRGTTVGVYNMCQSIGTFFGGAAAGALYHLHRDFIFGAIAFLGLFGILAISSLRLLRKYGF